MQVTILSLNLRTANSAYHNYNVSLNAPLTAVICPFTSAWISWTATIGVNLRSKSP